MMRTFEEYARAFEISCDPETLDLYCDDHKYYICSGSKRLLTPGLNEFSHPSESVIRFLITDLQLKNNTFLHGLSSHIIFSYLHDVFLSEQTLSHTAWETQLSADPFVMLKTSGRSVKPLSGPDDPLFTFSLTSLTGLIGAVNSFSEKVMSEINLEDNDSHPFPEILKLSYSRLSNDQKVALHALSSCHQSGTVLPLLLVLGEINPVEYAKGTISLKFQSEEKYTEILAAVAGVSAYLELLSEKAASVPLISDIISKGEGDTLEFKSTLRWDIRAGKTNAAIERSCLKTISAFLNSKGGYLLIGVRDDGSIEGIESDKFANEDKFLLHLWTLIRTCLGRDFSPYIRTRLEKLSDKTVCVVDCLAADRPAFLRQPGFDEQMFIRIGPSSNALDISEALKYIKARFGDNY
ncbi:MAG: ATP-binding protein [Bacteroidota bacterium]